MTTPKNRFEQNPLLTIFLFIAAISFLIVATAEMLLRVKGHKPGEFTKSAFFENVDSLYMTFDYISDDHGIMKVSQTSALVVKEFLASAAGKINSDSIIGLNHEWTINKLMVDFHQLKHHKQTDSELQNRINSLRQKPYPTLDDYEKAVLEYSEQPINKDGFRSIEFKNYTAPRKKVLLLGDSFTWGISSDPVTQSFADILLARGYICFNTGIACADPAQYEAIVRKYIPLLKPDVVIVNFYMGNDIVFFERTPREEQLIYYSTNAGWVDASPAGEYLPDFRDAFAYAKSQLVIPDTDKNLFRWLMSKTVITSKILWGMKKLGWISPVPEKFREYYLESNRRKSKTPISEKYILNIRNICDDNAARLMVGIIPDSTYAAPPHYGILPSDVFKETKYYIPDITVADYKLMPDGHFNNGGHKKYASFLEVVMDGLGTGEGKYFK